MTPPEMAENSGFHPYHIASRSGIGIVPVRLLASAVTAI
jgi:hypothetical protein